jgi:transposase InsO family protein
MKDEQVTTTTALAKKLGVSRSSLYYNPTKTSSDEALKRKIVVVMNAHQSYGHRRIAMALNMNKKPILRVMQIFGLEPKIRRKKPHKSNDCKKEPVSIPNLIKNQCAIRPNAIWVGDFTHVVYAGRFLYIATVMDVYTREILGWHIAWHHTTDLIIKAFEHAIHRRTQSPRIFHSDQASFSKKSSPWENGHQESWNGGFKLELGNPDRFACVEFLIEAIHLQVSYYNNQRIHTALKMSPKQFYDLKITLFANMCAYPLFTGSEKVS